MTQQPDLAAFAARFKQILKDHQPRSLTQQDVASALKVNKAVVSRWANGKRAPRRDQILDLHTRLGVPREQVASLLALLGYSRLNHGIGEPPDGDDFEEELRKLNIGGLLPPEREHLVTFVLEDLRHLREAWRYFVTMRVDIQQRDWSRIDDRFIEGMETYYRSLVDAAERYRAYLYAARATARHYLEDLAGAEADCDAGLRAASQANDRAITCVLLVRRAMIRQLQSRFREAEHDLDGATRALTEYEAEASDQERIGWCAHWHARLKRLAGVLWLFRGQPLRALTPITESERFFEKNDHKYELILALYSHAWAEGMLGHTSAALELNLRGLALTEELNAERSWIDTRNLFQGYLYVGATYLERDQLDDAERYLRLALKHVGPSAAVPDEYREAGRLYLLMGKLCQRRGRWDEAEKLMKHGIRFYRRTDDKLRLAAAHNYLGDLYLARERVRDALEEYGRARVFARTADPPSVYYGVAATINECRAWLRISPLPHDLARIERSLRDAEVTCRDPQYRHHLARLKVAEACLARVLGDQARMHSAASDASLHAAEFNEYLAAEINAELRELGAAQRTTVSPHPRRRRSERARVDEPATVRA